LVKTRQLNTHREGYGLGIGIVAAAAASGRCEQPPRSDSQAADAQKDQLSKGQLSNPKRMHPELPWGASAQGKM
jgi:hypothetical protein